MNIDATPKTMRADPPRPATPAPQPLADVVWLLTSVLERLAAVERRCGAGWVPHEEISVRLQRLVRGTATGGNGQELSELARRLTALEAAVAARGAKPRHTLTALGTRATAPGPATRQQQSQTPRRRSAKAPQRLAAGGPLRQAIRHILVEPPEPTRRPS